MYLKNLTLLGFKSFADRTVMNFLPGVTAIVGPNGCGKSNVSDAIRWVLGEQSAKALRGGEMADVIFNGTDQRKPLGMAEVSLTIGGVDQDRLKAAGIELPYDEVTVTRRVFRDGGSEYLINKTPCRLKDIQQLFMGTGVGRTSYSIMAQGNITQILSSKPDDRRIVFEEAAGITRFKAQKREALRKLEYTEQNMLRVADLIREVKRQIGSLQRQAGKARRYRALSEQLRHLETQLARHRYDVLQAEIQEKERTLQELRLQLDQSSQQVIQTEEELGQLRDRHSELEAEISQAQQRAIEIKSQLENHQERIRYNEERLLEIEAQHGQALQDIAQAEERLRTAAEELEEVKAQLTEVTARLEEQRQTLQQRREAVQRIENELALKQESLRTAQAEAFNTAQQLARTRNEINALDLQKQGNVARLEKLSAEKIQLEEERTRLTARLEEFAASVEAEKQSAQSWRGTVAERQERLQQLEEQVRELSAELDELLKQQAAKRSSLEVLEQLQTSREGFSEGTLAALEKTDRVLGSLADHIQVPSEHVTAIEAALGHHLQVVLTEEPETARAILEELTTHKKGQASIAPLSFLNGSVNASASEAETADSEAQAHEDPAASSPVSDEESQPAPEFSAEVSDTPEPAPAPPPKPHAPVQAQLGGEPVLNFITPSHHEEPFLHPGNGNGQGNGKGPHAKGNGNGNGNGHGLAPQAGASFDPPPALSEPPQDSAPVAPPAADAQHTAPQAPATATVEASSVRETGSASESSAFGSDDNGNGEVAETPHQQQASTQWGLPASSVVQAAQTVQPLVARLLGLTRIVPDLDTATRLWRETRGAYHFVTPAGEMLSRHGVFRGGISNGTSQTASSVLARKNQIQQLQTELAQLQQRIEELSRRKGALVSEQTEIQASLKQAQETLRDQEVAIATREGEYHALQNSHRLLEQKIETVIFELQSLAEQDEEGRRKRAELAEQLARLEQEEQAAQQRIGQLNQAIESLREQREQAQAALTETKVLLASEEQRHHSLQQRQQPLEQRLSELSQLIEQRRQSIGTCGERKLQAQAEIDQSRRAIEQLEHERTIANEQTAALLASRQDLEQQIESRENDLRACRSRLTALQEQRAAVEVEIAQKNMAVDNLRERIQQKYQVNLDEVRSECITITYAESGPPRIETVSPEEMEQAGVATDWDAVAEQVAALQKRLDEMGPVNLVAIEEYEETEQRYNTLNTQYEDLVQAKQQLLEALNRINTQTRQMFVETFEKIRANFQQLFVEIFGGGKADLRLVDENNVLESGIDIVARPPGKQLQNISLLSGGEQTMTAVALLFAIYQVKPSPFCVLDELDAPLDESNINRFIRILKRFLDHSQFIIITHNKRTIAMADALYGVTMEEKGVSKIVSVKFTPSRDRQRAEPSDAAAEPDADSDALEQEPKASPAEDTPPAPDQPESPEAAAPVSEEQEPVMVK